MKFRGLLCTLLFILSTSSLFAAVSMDPLWLFKDLPSDDKIFSDLIIRDTCRSFDFNSIYPVDTGVSWDSDYINLNYKFTNDSLVVADQWDPTTIMYKDYRPGYAGFKIDWDNGVTGFQLAKYKYLIIAHKGPLPSHKVTIRFGYNSGCGSPTFFQTIGSFAASSIWKIDTLLIPDSIRNVSESVVKNSNYYEMQFIINNADPADTNKSSAPGNFKVDDIALADRGSGVINRSISSDRTGSKRFFIPSTNGPMEVSAFSLSGEQLYCTTVAVVAGKKYTVGSFVKAHVPLSPLVLQCIKIRGAGVDILQKVW